jgi:dipeptidyl aminopeptidase/acylaminoacyl peptidase
MKSIVVTLLLLNLSTALFSQSLKTQVSKPAIDTSVLGKWPSAELPSISSNGNYAFYTIQHQPAEGSTLVIRSLKNDWKKEIINASNASFTDDSRKVFFISPRRILSSLALDGDNIDSVAQASSYRLVKQNGEEWLVYQVNSAAKELKAVNLKSNLQKSFTSVISYLFSIDGNVLVLLKQSNTDNKSQTVDWVNFPSGDTRTIWNGNGASSFILDKPGSQLAFVVQTKDVGRSIFYYRAGNEKAELLADNRTKGIDSNLVINGIADGFSKDGEKVFINLKEKESPKPKPDAVMVDVWSYQDAKLQSQQLDELSQPQSYKALVRIKDHDVARLQKEGDRFVSIVEQWLNKVEVTEYTGDLGEVYWNSSSKNLNYIVSTDNGERRELPLDPAPFLAVSPSGNYIMGSVKEDKNNLYCYNTSTGKILNVTKSISAPFDMEYGEVSVFGTSKWLDMASWLDNDKGVILFDRYDMWLVDPDGMKPPINLTKGLGEKNKIIFRLPEVYENKFISANGRIIISAFNRKNKEEGFYSIEMDKLSEGPEMLTMGKYNYEIPNAAFNLTQLNSSGPQRFIVRRESATQSPNYFLTTDFKTITPLTDVYPEREYNWLTSEQHTWKSLNVHPLQGILYKPETFEPKIKYPVIFHYYENMSDQLNKYLEPNAIRDHLNIPWFVSNGYLVFTPDIHYEIGKVGESGLNSIVSAAHYLQKYPWVDIKHIGLQGQSFGSYVTNFIVTHSTLFAAAMSSSGSSDLISAYGSLFGQRSAQRFFERGQGRMVASLWERPATYFKETAIFQTPQVGTPLLLMANKKDEFNFPQQLELFLSLRRLGKRAWMLQYDGEGHIIFLSHKAVALQHTIRITQFFDHYLKDSACPHWMLYGIPAKDKGIDDGLELVREKDPTTGKWLSPKEGSLLTDEEKKKVEKLKHGKPITITLE